MQNQKYKQQGLIRHSRLAIKIHIHRKYKSHTIHWINLPVHLSHPIKIKWIVSQKCKDSI